MFKILVIEDDVDINKLIVKILKAEGYHVVPAYSGTEGILRTSMESFDLLLCDLMLPGLPGEEVIEKVRQTSQMPIIVLTAKVSLDDKVNVFSVGADDYVTKPFEPRELVARVQAQLRRNTLLRRKKGKKEQEVEPSLTCKELQLFQDSMVVTIQNTKLDLTAREFEILKIMLQTPEKVFSKEALYEAVWKNGYYGEDNTISVHISNIRKKIAKITNQEYIDTVWGIGYRLHL